MALFKSAEEKAAIAAEKEQKALKKYGLESLTDPQDIESVKTIVTELLGTGLMEFGATLGSGSDASRVSMYYLRAIVEQNFIIIRQLDRLLKK